RDIHTPVLLERCAELLAPALQRDGAVFVDATLGMGGHSEAFLERFPGTRLIGRDRDTDALRIAGERLARFAGRTTFVHTVYDGIA
ncbi:16S rRNA (cytosine(1402)-N(4))-methyltransferase, partial [Acinetobacter baumannii]